MLCVDEKSQIQALGSHRADPADAARHARARHPRLQARRAPPASTPRWTSPPARSSARCTPATARSSSRSSCRRSTARSPPSSTSTSCSTTPRRTRRRRSSAGWPRTPASSCTSPRPALVAEPRRALVRRTDDQEAAPRRAPLRPPAQRRHPRLDRHLERRPQALRLDQDRRPDPRLDRPLLQPNQRITTLAADKHRNGALRRPDRHRVDWIPIFIVVFFVLPVLTVGVISEVILRAPVGTAHVGEAPPDVGDRDSHLGAAVGCFDVALPKLQDGREARATARAFDFTPHEPRPLPLSSPSRP